MLINEVLGYLGMVCALVSAPLFYNMDRYPTAKRRKALAILLVVVFVVCFVIGGILKPRQDIA